MVRTVKCDVCGKETEKYAVRAADRATLCPECCAEEVERRMLATGEATLYLVRDTAAEAMDALEGVPRGVRWEVTDWFGVLRFPVAHAAVGGHNIAGTRVDVWFYDRYGWEWHGVQYGKYSELCYCRRKKRRVPLEGAKPGR